MKKIVLVEDDLSIREELYNLLANSSYEPFIIKDFHNVKDEILKINPDLVLLDINIPYLNGEMVLKEIRKTHNIPVIMVTSRTDESDEVLSMSYGADDYITKPYNPTILLLRIAAIFKRIDQPVDKLIYEDLTLYPAKSLLSNEKEDVILTKNEMLIFQYLLNKKGTIVTRDELMTALWNSEEYINDNALTVNISRLRSKLALLNHAKAIKTRKKEGYILL